MNFDTLKITETKFREIADFYTILNEEPEDILSYLRKKPYTKQRIEAIQIRREQYMSSDFLLGDKLPTSYRLSGKDLSAWLYFDLIVPMRDEEFIIFFDELRAVNNEAEERSRIEWCDGFQSLLNFLSEQLTTLNSKSISIPNGTQDDWIDIKKEIKRLTNNHIKPLIIQYKNIIEKYTSNRHLATNTPKHNAIYILANARTSLINEISAYVAPSQYDSLKSLINDGTKPEQPIICHCKQARLGKIFYDRVKAEDENERQIQTKKANIAKWICQNFVREEAGEIKKLTVSTVVNALSNKGLSKS